MVGLDTEKNKFSSRVFVQNPKTRITPAKNPNKNPQKTQKYFFNSKKKKYSSKYLNKQIVILV
jgi:hypothetical protein